MTSNADAKVDDDASDLIETTTPTGMHIFGRLGTVALVTTYNAPGSRSAETIAAAIIESLRSDSRVTSVTPRSTDTPLSVGTFRFFPPWVHASHDTLATGEDAGQAIQFDPPLVIELSVPTKNQPVPEMAGESPIPAEQYSVVWDGITAIVAWEQDTPSMSLAGGHVVEPVLRSAAEAVGCELVVQSCNEHCESVFLHSTLSVIATWDEGEEPITQIAFNRFSVSVFSIEDRTDAVIWLSFRFLLAGESFARMKNIGARLMTIEDAAREELNEATSSHYRVNRPKSMRPMKRVKEMRQNRASRGSIRRSAANTDHFIALLELLRRQWNDARRDFENDDSEVLLVFSSDSRKDREKIESLDLERLENINTHISDSLSNWSMAKVTLWGALSGGFAGGILGAVATLLAG